MQFKSLSFTKSLHTSQIYLCFTLKLSFIIRKYHFIFSESFRELFKFYLFEKFCRAVFLRAPQSTHKYDLQCLHHFTKYCTNIIEAMQECKRLDQVFAAIYCTKNRLGSPVDCRTLTVEVPPIGKIHPFRKIAIWCPSRFHISKKNLFFMTKSIIFNH